MKKNIISSAWELLQLPFLLSRKFQWNQNVHRREEKRTVRIGDTVCFCYSLPLTAIWENDRQNSLCRLQSWQFKHSWQRASPTLPVPNCALLFPCSNSGTVLVTRKNRSGSLTGKYLSNATMVLLLVSLPRPSPPPQNTVPARPKRTCTGSRDDTGNFCQRKKGGNLF